MTATPGGRPRKLQLMGLVAVMFFCVSGGPFGLEGMVGSVGPGLALLLLLVIPVLYTIPEALLIGELASMLPAEGGYYVWVKRAFGPFWGFWNGWLSWAYSLVDMALYPVLFRQYLHYFVPELTPLEGWIVALAVIWIATGLNLRGTRTVGIASGWFVGLVVAPFAVLAALALVKWTGHPGAHLTLTPFHAAGTTFLGALGVGISQGIWNYSGWDNASTIGDEIQSSGSTYPKALARAVPLVTLVYLVTVIPTLAVSDWHAWTDGAWPALARTIVGGWLAQWIALAGMVSAFALFNALLLAYSRIPLALARDGLLPAALGRMDARDTPRAAVVVSAVVYSVCALIDFGDLLAADVLLYTLALVLEFGSLLALRRKEPTLRGPFRIPLPTAALALLATLPPLVLAAAVALELGGRTAGFTGVLVGLGLAAVGPGIYLALAPRAARQRASTAGSV
ncbi:MAG TPA: APC family permease [Gemmatimonadales bacterium]|nr:APC family permease [Gemmatimonadales bacterium]